MLLSLNIYFALHIILDALHDSNVRNEQRIKIDWHVVDMLKVLSTIVILCIAIFNTGYYSWLNMLIVPVLYINYRNLLFDSVYNFLTFMPDGYVGKTDYRDKMYRRWRVNTYIMRGISLGVIIVCNMLWK